VINKRYLVYWLLPLLAVIGGVVFLLQRSGQPVQVALTFHPLVGEQSLVLNEDRYANPGGEGTFRIRGFQFFISNIRLESESGNYVEPESYHLARFDGDDGSYHILLEHVPRRDYKRLEFGIGVDPQANGTITVAGDLDPNSRMAWSWDVGYKFVLFEGNIHHGNAHLPLVYHIGFDENYKVISVPLYAGLIHGAVANLEFRVDILAMFSGGTRVDMLALPNVKFDRRDAKRLADNYSGMIALCPVGCGH
jgi:hypothetical protein